MRVVLCELNGKDYIYQITRSYKKAKVITLANFSQF